MTAPPAPLLSLCAGVLWCLVLAAAGARLRRAARLPVGAWLRLPIDFLLGGWLLAVAALLCGLAGAFNTVALLLAAGAFAAAGRFEDQGWRWRPVLAALPAAALLLPIALARPFFYDALVYHLGLPWQALVEGRLSPHPEDFFSAFPPLAQLVAAFPLAAGLERVPALLHLASFLAGSAALAALALRLGAPRGLALLAGASLPILPVILPVAGFPAAEGWTDAAILASLAMTLGGRDDRGRALGAGFLGGVASAARLQGIPWTAIILCLVGRRSRSPSRRAAQAGVGWLAGSAPWWLKNLLLLGDPLAPLRWHPAGIETLRRETGTHLHDLTGLAQWPRDLAGTLAPHLIYLVPLLLGALPALFAGGREKGRLLGGAVLAGAGAWWMTGSVPRFLVPHVGALLGLAAAGGRRRPALLVGSGLALAWTAALGVVSTLGWIGTLGGAGLALVDRPPGGRDLVINDPRPAFALARDLPDNALVLFVGEARGYAFPRRFVAPSPYDASPLREPLERLSSAREARDWLFARGYTHLLVNRSELARLAGDYPAVPWTSARGKERFQELLDLTAPPVVRAGEVGVFALGAPP